MANTIFSDAWYRVADLRVALLPSVEIRTQVFRNRTWHVLQDTYTQRFFKVSEQACKFLRQLTVSQTVEEIWENFVNEHPEDAPSQEEVIQILSQLHVSNLLYSTEQGDNEAISLRYRRQKNREFMGKLMSFLFIRVPLWNPDPLLNRIQPLILWCTGWTAGLIWAVTLLFGGLAAFDNSNTLMDQTQGILSISNLPWLYVCLSLLKLFHEAGHAFVCKRFGGEVRTFGVMFLLLTPLPYVDASSSWGFANRWSKVYVSFAGMAVEFFFAALGALIWAHTGQGLINSLAFNVMLIGSVSSLLFNGNPLLRFDAYYMLSDWLEIPNFYQRAQQQWMYFGDRYLLGSTTSASKAQDQREWWWLSVYGFASFVYLIIVTVGISLFLMDQWMPLGILVLLMTLASKFVMPGHRLFKHLQGQATQPNRKRAFAVTFGLLSFTVIGLLFIPLPVSVRTHGVLQAKDSHTIYIPSSGVLAQLRVRHGDSVHKGQSLALLDNQDALQEHQQIEAALRENEAQYRVALHQSNRDLAAIALQTQSLQERLDDLDAQLADQNVTAPIDGEWVSPEIHIAQGSWLNKGHVLGEVVNRESFRFLAVIPQDKADYLFKQTFHNAELRLAGQAQANIPLPTPVILPFHSNKLPSAALGWMGGGELAIATNDPVGDKAKESFFILRVDVPAESLNELTALHGLTGTLRLELAPQPLALQAFRSLKQLVQKRYNL